MTGWDETQSAHTADADHPSAATIEKRRQTDLLFLAWVKKAGQDKLEKVLPMVKGWRRVAVQRCLRKVES
jgi:hypothetical protein